MLARPVSGRNISIAATGTGVAMTRSELDRATPRGFEPPTYRLGICRSILLSYVVLQAKLHHAQRSGKHCSSPRPDKRPIVRLGAKVS